MTGGEDAREETADGAPDIEAEREVPYWLDEMADVDVGLLEAILRRVRQGEGIPDGETIFAMKEPLRRLVGGCMLLRDLAAALHRNREAARPQGLLFLSNAIEHEAMDLHRLYHGHPPRGC